MCERIGDALIDGSWLRGLRVGLAVCLDGLEGEGLGSVGKFEGDAGHSGGGAMFDGQNDAVVAVAA